MVVLRRAVDISTNHHHVALVIVLPRNRSIVIVADRSASPGIEVVVVVDQMVVMSRRPVVATIAATAITTTDIRDVIGSTAIAPREIVNQVLDERMVIIRLMMQDVMEMRMPIGQPVVTRGHHGQKVVGARIVDMFRNEVVDRMEIEDIRVIVRIGTTTSERLRIGMRPRITVVPETSIVVDMLWRRCTMTWIPSVMVLDQQIEVDLEIVVGRIGEEDEVVVAVEEEEAVETSIILRRAITFSVDRIKCTINRMASRIIKAIIRLDVNREVNLGNTSSRIIMDTMHFQVRF